ASEKVVGHYEEYCTNKKSYNTIRNDLPGELERQSESAEGQDCRINSLAVRDLDGNEISSLKALQDVVLEMEVEVLRDGVEGYFGFAFMKSAEEPVASFLTIDAEGVETGPFSKGDVFTVSLTVRNLTMRVGSYYVVGGLSDDTGLLWYETRFSKLLTVEANKGVGPLIMPSEWSVRRR
ncbi:MAG: hypothetical protein F4234_03605, partial [Gammaproteobacteria bacterium]|nr:hypothetical protein [Gammaproteobacteria bacterium]